jgi:hypothetical protein
MYVFLLNSLSESRDVIETFDSGMHQVSLSVASVREAML